MSRKKSAEATGNNLKVETIEEFLARGGRIKILPRVKNPLAREQTVFSVSAALQSSLIMTLSEASDLYGESTERKRPKSKSASAGSSEPSAKAQDKLPLDVNALPPSLREKLLAKYKREVLDVQED